MTISKALKEKADTLARLFGANSGIITKSACRGKYAGTYDYSVAFDNGVEYFVTNGFKYFEEVLDNMIKLYSAFPNKKDKVINYYKECSKVDNEHANFLGLETYEVVDVEFIKNGHLLGWFYIPLKLSNGTIVNFLESGLNANIRHLIEDEDDKVYMRKHYFVAGGLEDKEVDFIFDCVGHSSTSKMYKAR